MNDFLIRDGMLQAADVNPKIAGPKTPDFTNPRIVEAHDNQAEAGMEIATGRKIRRISPLVFLLAAAGGLFLIGYFQRKSA